MTFFPVPHNTPPKPVKPIVRTPAPPVVKTARPMPEELKQLVAQTTSQVKAEPLPVPPPAQEDLSLPSLTQMAKNVLGSLGRTAKSAVRGEQVKVSAEDAETRLTICRACPYFRHTDERCSKCGCYMAVKTYLKAEKCPIGKW